MLPLVLTHRKELQQQPCSAHFVSSGAVQACKQNIHLQAHVSSKLYAYQRPRHSMVKPWLSLHSLLPKTARVLRKCGWIKGMDH